APRGGGGRPDRLALPQRARGRAASGGRGGATPPVERAARRGPPVPRPGVVLRGGGTGGSRAAAPRRVRCYGPRADAPRPAVPLRRGGGAGPRGGPRARWDQRVPRLVRRGRLHGLRPVRAGARLRAGARARLGARRVRALHPDTRPVATVRRSRDPGADLQAAGGAVRAARPARQGARLLRAIRGPVEERRPGAAATGAGRQAAAGEIDRGRREITAPALPPSPFPGLLPSP